MRWWTRTLRRPVVNARGSRPRGNGCGNAALHKQQTREGAFSRRHILRTFRKEGREEGEKKGIKYSGQECSIYQCIYSFERDAGIRGPSQRRHILRTFPKEGREEGEKKGIKYSAKKLLLTKRPDTFAT